jgi:hypothetical protein
MRKQPRNAPPPTMGLNDEQSRMKQAIAEKKQKGEKLTAEEEAFVRSFSGETPDQKAAAVDPFQPRHRKK